MRRGKVTNRLRRLRRPQVMPAPTATREGIVLQVKEHAPTATREVIATQAKEHVICADADGITLTPRI